ncbi:AI-2E family transporter [Williamsia sterculiae]|nr:AI-2E family transporter [Williamsia sterculiae]
MTGSDHDSDRTKVHPLVRAAAEWSWRLLVIMGALYVLFLAYQKFGEVLVPVGLAILGAAFLAPAVDWLHRHRVPRSLSVIITLLVAMGVLAGILAFVIEQFIDGLPRLTAQVTDTVNSVKDWLVHGPFNVPQEQMDHIGNDVVNVIQKNQDKVTTGALATAATVTEIVTGTLLTIFLMIFFLYGGGQIWRFCTKVIPIGSRARVMHAGVAGFGTLVGYVRATVAVALVDAVGIGVGLAILQVPLALPLASLVFIGAFIPIVGALVTGTLAVLIALITNGWIAAVIATAIVVAVMQIESHVLQPFLLGRSVRLHPVAVVLGIAAGIVTAGIVGGLLAVPAIAFFNTAVRSLYAELDSGDEAVPADPAEPEPDSMYGVVADEPIWDEMDAPGVHGPLEPGGDRDQGTRDEEPRDEEPGNRGRPGEKPGGGERDHEAQGGSDRPTDRD